MVMRNILRKDSVQIGDFFDNEFKEKRIITPNYADSNLKMDD